MPGGVFRRLMRAGVVAGSRSYDRLERRDRDIHDIRFFVGKILAWKKKIAVVAQSWLSAGTHADEMS